jgi:hypothetical protein
MCGCYELIWHHSLGLIGIRAWWGCWPDWHLILWPNSPALIIAPRKVEGYVLNVEGSGRRRIPVGGRRWSVQSRRKWRSQVEAPSQLFAFFLWFHPDQSIHRWHRWTQMNEGLRVRRQTAWCYELFSGRRFGLFVVAGFFRNSRAGIVFCNRIAMNWS